ncbi:MAG: membrane protein insertase YidC [Prevotellaceae bacterium]|jgi:YidC/Oxa1 family membrane protein insertase|nr:membrane protein insertase YidC [Prevotellaceae bacterium]
MDKNTGIGLLLIAAILGGYMWWNAKTTETYNKERQRIHDSLAKIERVREEIKPEETEPDSLKQARLQNIAVENLGELMASSLVGTEELYTVENDKLIVTFSNKGGRIWSVEFKDYQNYNDFKAGNENPLKLFYGDANDFSLEWYSNTQNIKTSAFYFEPVIRERNMRVDSDSLTVPFRLYADSVAYVEFVYTLYRDRYNVALDVNFSGMDKYIDPRATTVDVNWKLNFSQQEKGFTNENNYTNIAYKYPGETSIKDITAAEKASEDIKTKLEWINFKQHFFSAVIYTGGSINNKLSSIPYPEDNPEKLLKTIEANLQMEFNSKKNDRIPLEFYFLPNHFSTLRSYGHSFEKIIPLGDTFVLVGPLIGVINRFVVIPVVNFLQDYIVSFGLVILLLTLIIKILLMPLTWKSYLSSAKMRVLKPEIDKIGAKYPDSKDAMKKQQEIMALYKKTGVSMLGGCLPSLLQLPIFIALFRFFPSSFELRQKNFLWADDLSAYDSILELPFSIPFYGSHVSLFTLLMAVSMILSSKIMMSQQGGVNSQMKQMNMMMIYVMPIFMLAFFNNYSSGLTYYYFVSNLITLIQNLIIRKYFVNEAELLKKLNARAAQQGDSAKKKKKMSFTERLMQKQRELERLKKQQEKNRKKK